MYQTSLLAASYLTVCNSVHKMSTEIHEVHLQWAKVRGHPERSQDQWGSGRSFWQVPGLDDLGCWSLENRRGDQEL